ncbi:winged helix-turn-helix transcriptional regulator [Marinicrinis sediminis]|uniref:Winged helix-turn-helix transcriptional regulator n=1 Tax=Marinicrinis sediminis TaxID=1652465 RepID=A0ABW5R789_9BACL
MMEPCNQHVCPKVEGSYQIISKKWTGLIIHVLMNGPKHFNEIHTCIPNLSNRMLTERIKELEDHAIIVRNVITERPIRSEYALTEKGKELGEALSSINQWAEKWM